MPGTHLIFVNSFEAATELLDKRSSIYSDRCVVSMFASRSSVLTPVFRPSTGMTMVRDLFVSRLDFL